MVSIPQELDKLIPFELFLNSIYASLGCREKIYTPMGHYLDPSSENFHPSSQASKILKDGAPKTWVNVKAFQRMFKDAIVDEEQSNYLNATTSKHRTSSK